MIRTQIQLTKEQVKALKYDRKLLTVIGFFGGSPLQ